MSKKIFGLKQLMGLYLTMFGMVIMLKLLFDIKIIYIILFLMLIPGTDLIVRSLLKEKSRKLIIPGMLIMLSSISGIIYSLILLPNSITLQKVWPIIGLIPSISMALYYIVSSKKNAAIIIPALFIMLLSSVMVLFTTEIIKMDFKKFILLLITGMSIFIGLYLLFAKKIQKIQEQIEQKIFNSNDED